MEAFEDAAESLKKAGVPIPPRQMGEQFAKHALSATRFGNILAEAYSKKVTDPEYPVYLTQKNIILSHINVPGLFTAAEKGQDGSDDEVSEPCDS
mmetsp:Transcript_501/g.678  ORF Transcript_501/g.678 Transcript_501/m.678 type:complete len:95 (+) Transcript_501:143-427(+)